MLSRFATWFARTLLSLSVLTDTDRVKLSCIIMDELGVLPIKEIIEVDKNGSILVMGKSVDLEMAQKLKESATATLNSYARSFVHEQVVWEAIKLGVQNVETERQMLFARAAIWFAQQENNFLQFLAGQGEFPE